MKRVQRLLIAVVALSICGSVYSQDFALSSNLLDYLAMGTINLGAEYGVAQHWSLGAKLKYNPFSYNNGENVAQSKQRAIQIGGKYWTWHIFSGWWLSAYAKYQEYNVGGLSSPHTSEGDRFGASAGAGYSFMLNPHLNLDVGASFWTGYDVYTSYACPTCGNVVDKGHKMFFLPSDFLLSLTYIF